MNERKKVLQELIDNFLKEAKAKQLTIGELDKTIHELEQQARQLKIAE